MARHPRKSKDGAPPVVPGAGGLSPSDRCKIEEHLSTHLAAADVRRLVQAISHWIGYGPSASTQSARGHLDRDREHKKRIGDLTRDLRRGLAQGRPLWKTSGIDWPALEVTLARVEESAREEAIPEPVRRGAPREKWRDDLIALVFAHYPPSLQRRRDGSDVEKTIEMVLGFLGVELVDLHRQVMRTLTRKHPSPFVLTLM